MNRFIKIKGVQVIPKILQNVREQLIDEARRQIAKSGYKKTTIRSVANGCGFGVGTVYNYFPSKEALEGISEARSFFPGDPEIAFWAGCIYEKIGQSQEAVPLFVQASATSNGLILDQLKNKQTERNEDLD